MRPIPTFASGAIQVSVSLTLHHIMILAQSSKYYKGCAVLTGPLYVQSPCASLLSIGQRKFENRISVVGALGRSQWDLVPIAGGLKWKFTTFLVWRITTRICKWNSLFWINFSKLLLIGLVFLLYDYTLLRNICWGLQHRRWELERSGSSRSSGAREGSRSCQTTRRPSQARSHHPPSLVYSYVSFSFQLLASRFCYVWWFRVSVFVILWNLEHWIFVSFCVVFYIQLPPTPMLL
jgi:hypothetical protein